MSSRVARACLLALWLSVSLLGCGHYGPPSRGPEGSVSANAPALPDPACTEEEEETTP